MRDFDYQIDKINGEWVLHHKPEGHGCDLILRVLPNAFNGGYIYLYQISKANGSAIYLESDAEFAAHIDADIGPALDYQPASKFPELWEKFETLTKVWEGLAFLLPFHFSLKQDFFSEVDYSHADC
jgi:hypothetical protein